MPTDNCQRSPVAEIARVRFAPSPTGELHLGNAHTALFNWLFARHSDGILILRIEDTDVTRSDEAAERAIVEGLQWLDLPWDEGPDRGGPFGPYRQSERLAIYQSYAGRLLGEDLAYRCYCSPERLEVMRQEQRRRGEPPRYDGRCRLLSQAEVRECESQGDKPVIRFKSPSEGDTAFLDLLRGVISFPNRALDDFIILKSDGYPTYHLASVVDDHLMQVSHVLRADEWIPSTPRHLLLYQAFRWEPPGFLHLPMILDRAGGKLSKRHGDVSVEAYRHRGYLPEAVVNYLALLGWSPEANEEVLSREELTKQFSWQRISVSPATFDLDRLNWFNKWYIRHLPVVRIARGAVPYLREAYGTESRSEGTSYGPDEWLELLMDNVREELDNLAQVPVHVSFAFVDDLAWTSEARTALQGPRVLQVLTAASGMIEAVQTMDTSAAASLLHELRSRLKKSANLQAREVMLPIRACLTGSVHGPSLAVVMALLGKERCLGRLQRIPDPF
jgi:nondiscriminating glutamyl-tRNA synthetase